MNLKTRLIKLEEKIEPDTFLVFYNPELAAAIENEKKVESAAPISITVIKKSTITCTKGKTTKKVAGLNPKCPTGYKKK